jgi:Uma2 family endonuclease
MEPFDFGRGGPGGWVLLDEPELHLGRDVLVPDLAGWRRERMPKMPEVAGFDLAPDWVCEVLSPSTAVHDRVHKMPVYLRAGVTHLWLIDPLLQMVEAYRSQDARWTLLVTLEGAAQGRIEPFEALELDLSVLWQR